MYKTCANAKTFPKRYAEGGGEVKVETAGYMTTKHRIESMMCAGQRLVEARKEMYDFEGEVDEDFYDPTRDPGFDRADASQIEIDLESKAKAFKTNVEAINKAVKANKKGGEESPPPKGDKTPPEGQ